ncbi:hypothetical protein MKZ25_10330 [Solibacillus sp. FSL W7-1464]|uniref:hypothetical protein n=1 Tax=Solibacillus sp. FSL W7-1464 TaxID=2921706 RepID=UPI0030FC90F0
MRKMIEPFLIAEIASDRMEEDMLYYYDSQGQLLADVYQQDGQFCSATFYGEGEFKHVTKEQAVEIAEATKKVFGQDHLQLQSIEREEEGYLAEFRRIEPVYGLLVQGVGLFVTVTDTGFVASVTLHELDLEICYPETMISKEEARALIQQQPILQLGIAREMGWQYTYKPNYDLFGVDPDGKVRLWSEDEAMKDASFEPLPEVEAITDFDAFLKGGRDGIIEYSQSVEEKCWSVEAEDRVSLQDKVFIRACQVVKYLVGEAYEHYYFEQMPTLRKLLQMDKQASVAFRFVYIYEDISFDFEALTIFVHTGTNQISSVQYRLIPFETFPTLKQPTISLQQANNIAGQLIDVELLLENDLVNERKRSFVYTIDYPTSPTGAHIQFVDAYTGEIHWIDNR